MLGRPTSYRPEYCQQVIELGATGVSKSELATHFGVTRETIYQWARMYPDFSDALVKAVELSQSWWEQQASKGLWAGKQFNGALWSRVMAARFPRDYQTVRKVDVSNSDGSLAQNGLDKNQIEAKLKAIHEAAVMRSQQIDNREADYDPGLDLV